MPYSIREVLRRLRNEGWIEMPDKGSHRVFRKGGKENVSVPTSYRELSVGTYKSIAKRAGWE